MPEANLARAKLIVMLYDLAGKGISVSPNDRSYLKMQAQHWFFSRHSDFASWCELAGYSPGVVRRAAGMIFENGLGNRFDVVLGTDRVRRKHRKKEKQNRKK